MAISVERSRLPMALRSLKPMKVRRRARTADPREGAATKRLGLRGTRRGSVRRLSNAMPDPLDLGAELSIRVLPQVHEAPVVLNGAFPVADRLVYLAAAQVGRSTIDLVGGILHPHRSVPALRFRRTAQRPQGFGALKALVGLRNKR